MLHQIRRVVHNILSEEPSPVVRRPSREEESAKVGFVKDKKDCK